MSDSKRLTRQQTQEVFEAGRCVDCGVELDAGTAKVFTVCDACWEMAYRPKSSPEPFVATGKEEPRILGVKEIADFPRSTLSATAVMASHELLRADGERLREENAGLRRDIEALLTHPVIAARRIRAARRSVSEGARDE